ncbi:Calcium-dependent protein kinase 2 [Babesia microti strain RI]|uniref:Calcium-dependent protein kinase 2 n=1 Tax=Babesia microti (strain RI) TaxID=1133968 RepID=A0A0K3AQU5_BABMR|nr:Calcium-dependent protein kinase 2 [Babesia microti strain RI]CTQ40993.1 Calcium-dependent protein kinase 2 [Babesia microti strain RI]|eukprot:XP_012649004.1 Calcium-dependent protein kinase 2 [Babesia microti strain RI]
MGNCGSREKLLLPASKCESNEELEGKLVVKHTITPDLCDAFLYIPQTIFHEIKQVNSIHHKPPLHISEYFNFTLVWPPLCWPHSQILTRDIWTSRLINLHDLSTKYTISTTSIGVGVCGSVRQVVNRITQKIYALKSFQTKDAPRKKLTNIYNEAAIHGQLDHPHIVLLREIYDNKDGLHLIVEYCYGKELYRRLDSYKRFNESYAKKLTTQILLALNYLHSNGICHRDLKLENCVLSTLQVDSNLKLIDFGFARLFKKGLPMSAMHGTVYYVSPEVIDGCYNEACDIWSLGVIVYMMLSGKPPFNGSSDKEILLRIKREKIQFTGARWSGISNLAIDFIKQLLNRDETSRASAKDALKHSWLAECIYEMESHKIPKGILEHLVNFSKSSPFYRVICSLHSLEIDRSLIYDIQLAFFKFNSSFSGTISLQEFQSIMCPELGLTALEAEQVFKKLLFRGKPELHFSEFIAATIEYKSKLDYTNTSFLYKKLDVQNQGYLDLRSFLLVLGDKFNDTSTVDIFKQADINKDGILDFTEFYKAITA